MQGVLPCIAGGVSWRARTQKCPTAVAPIRPGVRVPRVPRVARYFGRPRRYADQTANATDPAQPLSFLVRRSQMAPF